MISAIMIGAAANVATTKTMAMGWASILDGRQDTHGILNTLFSAEAEKNETHMHSDRPHYTCKGTSTVQSGNLAVGNLAIRWGED